MDESNQPGQSSIYEIDEEGRIVFVNEFWDAFARTNQGEHLVGAQVIGTVLWDHIGDPSTRQLYRMIVSRARQKGATLQFPFRCDSPDTVRHMSMRVERTSSGGCRFTSTIERIESRPPAPLLDPAAPRAGQWVRICSWCKKIALPDNRWVEIDVAVDARELFVQATPPPLTHTICPDCLRERSADAGTIPE